MDVPTTIPFYFKVTILHNKVVKTPAILLYVGKNHATIMNTLLAKIPFPDVQLIPISQKRSDPAIFDKQIWLHKTLCKKSQAMKLTDTSEDLRMTLAHEIREHETVGEHIIDVAEASSTAAEGTLYVLCLDDQKQLVTDYVKDFF